MILVFIPVFKRFIDYWKSFTWIQEIKSVQLSWIDKQDICHWMQSTTCSKEDEWYGHKAEDWWFRLF